MPITLTGLGDVPLAAPNNHHTASRWFAAHLALSEKGFTDEQVKRYLSRMEVARSVVQLGYSTDKRDVQPMLGEALMAPAWEPTDAEIYGHFLQDAGLSRHKHGSIR